MASKSDLRNLIIKNRNEKDALERLRLNKEMLKQISQHPKFIKSKRVGIYYPLPTEIDVRELINLFPDKTFAYPKIVEGNLVFLSYEKDTQFEKSNFNVFEPKTGNDISSKLDLVITPALGMNKSNYRLGFGKGYYDMFYKKYPKSYKIGIIYKDEEVEFNQEDHDIALDCYLMG